MYKIGIYFLKNRLSLAPFNYWDLIALIIILSLIFIIAVGTKQMLGPFSLGEIIPISLSPSHLPDYALNTVLRMFLALFVSLLFTFIFGTLAAKNKHAEKIIIPLIDILQSVPILGFLSITVIAFIHLFPGSLLGPECACIFAIFTSQVWNMALSFYQNLRMVPADLLEAAAMFHLSAWQRFWRVEVPFAMPALLWNTMMSMSGSWFFVVASEAITVANQNITLPGIGSYIATAITHADGPAICYAILTMLIVILLYDQILFRPLVSWAEKFKLEMTGNEYQTTSWLARLLRRSYIYKHIVTGVDIVTEKLINFSLFREKSHANQQLPPFLYRIFEGIGSISIILIVLIAAIFLARFIITQIPLQTILHTLGLGLITLFRVFAVLIVATLIWVPLGVWIGMRPKFATLMQPFMQFMAAFPANLLFPLVVLLIVKYHLNVEIWVTFLMLIGTQWYIAFNIIAGTIAIPKDLHQAANNFDVRGWLRWRRLILPAIFPYYITGAITAAGAAWNVSIVAEVVSWGHTKLQATGLGAFITEYTGNGYLPYVALGISIMCIFVLTLNHLIWRPLYNRAQKRFRLD